MNKKIIIGARSSKLSLAYANKVKKLILQYNSTNKIEIIIKTIKTTGDLFKEQKMSEIGGKNFFCKEIEEELISKKIDIAVHSLIDMETIENSELIVGAYLKRNDPRDALILNKKKKFKDLKNISIGSSSKRRELQLKILNKEILIKNIRGNIDTRIEKVKTGEYEGIIIAFAGVKFLNLEKHVNEIFDEDKIIPAAGQGVIAAQCRANDNFIIDILKNINHKETKICATAEKNLLKAIGGDCHTAVGALAKIINNKIFLSAQLFSDDGKKFHKIKKIGSTIAPAEVGKIAGEELLKLLGNNYKKKI